MIISLLKIDFSEKKANDITKVGNYGPMSK